MLIRFPAVMEENGADILKVSGLPFARYKQARDEGKRTSFIREHTLVFVLQGHKQLHFGEQSHKAEAGNLLLIKRGVYVLSEFVPEGLNYEALLLFFSDDLLKKFLHTYNLTASLPAAAPAHLILDSNELLDGFKMQFMSYFGKNVEGIEFLVPLKMQELLLLLLAGPRRQQVLAFLQSIAFGQPLDVDYIVRTHLFQPLTLEELAKLSGRSLASFKRDFQQKFQCAPKKWINEQRLAHARMLLLHSDRQVAEIAMDCGFENIPHFIRIFKQEYGITPNAIRAKKAII